MVIMINIEATTILIAIIFTYFKCLLIIQPFNEGVGI